MAPSDFIIILYLTSQFNVSIEALHVNPHPSHLVLGRLDSKISWDLERITPLINLT